MADLRIRCDACEKFGLGHKEALHLIHTRSKGMAEVGGKLTGMKWM
jgi:7-keto-8-aminopelargonate synthetase-like enzyme